MPLALLIINTLSITDTRLNILFIDPPFPGFASRRGTWSRASVTPISYFILVSIRFLGVGELGIIGVRGWLCIRMGTGVGWLLGSHGYRRIDLYEDGG